MKFTYKDIKSKNFKVLVSQKTVSETLPNINLMFNVKEYVIIRATSNL